MPLSRDDILGKLKLAVEEVQVPEWGGSVFVREMSGEERDAWEAIAFAEGNKAANVRATLAATCICDADGKRLLSDADVSALGKTSAAALDRVFDAALRINRLRKKDYEDSAKN